MDNDELEFKFSMLSKKQLIKLCGAYNVKINGSIPNNNDSLEDILYAVELQLKVLDDGSIMRKDDKNIHNDAKFHGGNKVRLIII
jgi:hypothetical protein